MNTTDRREPKPLTRRLTHYHDTDSAETGWCSGCGRTDLRDTRPEWLRRSTAKDLTGR